MFLEVAETARLAHTCLLLEGQISHLETVEETANVVYSLASLNAATNITQIIQRGLFLFAFISFCLNSKTIFKDCYYLVKIK